MQHFPVPPLPWPEGVFCIRIQPVTKHRSTGTTYTNQPLGVRLLMNEALPALHFDVHPPRLDRGERISGNTPRPCVPMLTPPPPSLPHQLHRMNHNHSAWGLGLREGNYCNWVHMYGLLAYRYSFPRNKSINTGMRAASFTHHRGDRKGSIVSRIAKGVTCQTEHGEGKGREETSTTW